MRYTKEQVVNALALAGVCGDSFNAVMDALPTRFVVNRNEFGLTGTLGRLIWRVIDATDDSLRAVFLVEREARDWCRYMNDADEDEDHN